MVKKGDTVRYLNEVGGGIVSRVEGKIAYIDDDGFERPVAVNELVVVLPVGHKPTSGAKLMFDQQAFDTGRTSHRNKPDLHPVNIESTGNISPAPISTPEPEEEPIEETEYGDDLNVIIAFEPKDIHKLDTTSFNMVLVNDSNYYMDYQLLCRGVKAGEWELLARGGVVPNEIVDLKKITRDDIPTLERLVFQGIAYKKDKSFIVKEPLNVHRKVDLTKFFKFHCYSPGLYFDEAVLEIPLLNEPSRPDKKKKLK